MTSLHRSGTHWVKHMIAGAMGVPALEERILSSDALRRAWATYSAGRLCYDHFDFSLHGAFLDPARMPGLRMVLLYRHPLDALISQFYWRAQNKALLDPDRSPIENLKLYLRGYGSEHYGAGRYLNYWPLQTFRSYLKNYVMDWVSSNRVLPVRYEDLTGDTERSMRDILHYLGVPFRSSDLQEVIAKNRFEIHSGGRPRGQSSDISHYRKGISGEWREVLDAEDLAIVRKDVGDYLERLGYSLDAAEGKAMKSE
jgi:hypothetical protein